MTSISQRDFAIQTVQTLQNAGYQALWAGGCVRDQLLGKQPNDYDVATSATPDQIQDLFGRRRTLAIGAAFGVITVVGPKSAGHIEVATFRMDAEYSDGRHPDSVQFSTAEEDAKRRDFTINGLFYDPIKDTVIDFVGGQEDLEKNLLRAIGDPNERIAEDKLRMLRAVRFAATFGMEIDPSTLSAIQQRHSEISVVSQERIGAELRKMLGHTNRHLAYQWLIESRLFEDVIQLPSVSDEATNLKSIKECFAILESIPDSADHCLAMSALLKCHVDSKTTVQSTCESLKWSNRETDKTVWIWTQVEVILKSDTTKWSIVQPILINGWAREALALADVLIRVSGGRPDPIEFCQMKLQLPSGELDPRPFLDGGALKELSIAPGPIYKKILDSTRAAQLDGVIQTRSDAVRMAKQLSNE